MASGNTMPAAVLHGPNDLRLEEVPIPQPQADEALVAITANGICGSDVHFFLEGKLGPFVVDRPYVPGHEACGVVTRPAGHEPTLTEGARVAIEPGIPCRRCRHCKTGRYNLCRNVRFLSAPPENGTFARYINVPEDFLHPVPHSLIDEDAAMIEPFSVALQACNRAAIRPGTSFAVLGAGPIGLITYLTAVAYGAGPGVILDLDESRLEFARSLAQAEAVNPRTVDAAEAVRAAAGGDGADTVFDCTGSSKAASMTPELAAAGGVVVLVGWPEISRPEFPLEAVLEKELDVRGVNRYCNTFPTAIRLLSEGRVNLRPLVSHRYEFSSVIEAFKLASEHPSQTVKVIVGEA